MRQSPQEGPTRGSMLLDTAIALAILAGIAALSVPVTDYLRARAQRAEEERVVLALRAALAEHFGWTTTIGNPEYPDALDGAPLGSATQEHPFFIRVLSAAPVVSDWQKLGPHDYRGPTGQRYRYTPPVGTFRRVQGDASPPSSGEGSPQRTDRTGKTTSVRQRLESGSSPGSVQ